MTSNPDSVVHLVRTAEGRYLAMNRNGVELELGSADDVFSPVELLLAAIAGCTAIDLDLATIRYAEPETFKVGVDAVRSTEGGNHLEDIHVTFSLRYPDTEGGDAARSMVERAVQLSRDELCAVSRTIESGTPVETTVKFCEPFRDGIAQAS